MTGSRGIIETEVAIVGYGPTGAALAALLAKQGVRTLVLEREGAAYHLPRAVHFDAEVMRVFQAIGVAEAMVAHTCLAPGMRFVDARGRLLLDWSRPLEIGPEGWHASYRFHQPDLERVLRGAVAQLPAAEVRTRAEVFALDQDPTGVTIRWEELDSGRIRAARACWVVGCDGARSLVRRFMGAEWLDLGFHERWLVTDLILTRPRPDLGDHTVQFCDPQRPMTYVRGVGNRRRWEIALRPGEDATEMTRPETVWRLLERWIGPSEAEIERATVYTFHSALAARWRAGRLLLAGDSAHQTPPFLGQGLCAGIRDAANLAWKLARVQAGLAQQSLLDSYESERAPHVRAYIEMAVRLGGLINTRAMEAVVPGSVLSGGPPAQMESIRPPLGPGLSGGWTGPTGRVAPQPVLGDGVRLDDRVGYRFALLLRPSDAATLPTPPLDALARRGAVLVADAALTPWLDDIGALAALVRPDRYVLGAARDADELAALAAAI
ncbi:MAG: bifunctional 3-(3-hydroxy-phenyl)propionate/3-hydroxycinnamic acid hydroxylase [Rhodovarius sp.]|nr:bifunctional 3-(3-hydroxy-phenyl)propionate/3-hydroxycinnamic acid hydroxylase [Rhodovarius sp.]